MISREKKILRINQAHVAPGMSLDRWVVIMAAHGVFLTLTANPWDQVEDAALDAIIAEIAGIVRAAREPEIINLLDLYRPGTRRTDETET